MAKKEQDKNAMLSLLNEDQKEAVLTENKRVLVLAGAGAGKTKTILEKIKYLIRVKGVKAQEILAITFTKNAANEMIDRLIDEQNLSGDYQKKINDKTVTQTAKRKLRYEYLRKYQWIGRLTIRTFHSLCYTILKNYGVAAFDNKFKLLLDDKQEGFGGKVTAAKETKYEVIHKLIIWQAENREYLLRFKKYLIDYMVDRIQSERFIIKKNQFNNKIYTTLSGDKVRSKSEQYIADWLYRHSIPYVYEAELIINDISIKPDFFLPSANLYIEHVSGLSKGTAKKKSIFAKLGKTIEYTYEDQMLDSNLINLALSRITKDRLPDDHQYALTLSYEEEFKNLHQEVRLFIRQLLRVIDMVQVDQITLEEIIDKLKVEKHQRVKEFYHLIIPIIQAYKKYTEAKSYLDFNSLITKTIQLLKQQPEIQEKYHRLYKYVLVDEFQDVNKSQVLLIRKLMNPNAHLFCVGDDWQSIYGFRGSDVCYVVDFHKYFKEAEIISLRTNYRSTPPIVNASNKVISNNKNQIVKKLLSSKKSNKKIEIYAGVDMADNLDFVVEEIRLLASRGIQPQEILFLYRRSKMFTPFRERFKKEQIKVQSRTIHAAKGQEAKIVFIIGMTEGPGGFPDIWLDDRIYYLLRPLNHDVLLEEERRLFYVALTRAQDQLYLITELGVESSFIHEIPETYKVSYTTSLIQDRNAKMPVCKNCGVALDVHYNFCPRCGTKM